LDGSFCDDRGQMTGPPPSSWAVDPADAGARELLPGLWRLRLPLPWPGIDHVNAYAVRQADGLLLIDCGTAGHPTCVAALDRALEQTGHELADVRTLVLTHAHSDHAGLAAHVVRRSGADLWSHPADGHFFDVLRDPPTFSAARGRRARREGVPAGRLCAYATADEELEGAVGAVAADYELVDGIRLPSALGDWEVLETPGHAPSHVCLLQRERRLLIAGDLLCVAFVPWLDYGFTADPLAEMLASLRRVEALGPIELALPGHGRGLRDVAATIAEHRAGFAERLDAVRAALADGPLGGYALTARLHGDEPDLVAVGRLAEVLSQLRHLRCRGEVVREVGDDGTYRYRAATAEPAGHVR
jgi:glyoxylase-like metal-dependent hydrolase (beta-lactamase superfamily II)